MQDLSQPMTTSPIPLSLPQIPWHSWLMSIYSQPASPAFIHSFNYLLLEERLYAFFFLAISWSLCLYNSGLQMCNNTGDWRMPLLAIQAWMNWSALRHRTARKRERKRETSNNHCMPTCCCCSCCCCKCTFPLNRRA